MVSSGRIRVLPFSLFRFNIIFRMEGLDILIPGHLLGPEVLEVYNCREDTRALDKIWHKSYE